MDFFRGFFYLLVQLFKKNATRSVICNSPLLRDQQVYLHHVTAEVIRYALLKDSYSTISIFVMNSTYPWKHGCPQAWALKRPTVVQFAALLKGSIFGSPTARVTLAFPDIATICQRFYSYLIKQNVRTCVHNPDPALNVQMYFTVVHQRRHEHDSKSFVIKYSLYACPISYMQHWLYNSKFIRYYKLRKEN